MGLASATGRAGGIAQRSLLGAEDVLLAHKAPHPVGPDLAPAILAVLHGHKGMGAEPGPQGRGRGRAGPDRNLGAGSVEGTAAAGHDTAVDPGDPALGIADLAPFGGLGDHLNGQAGEGPHLVRFQGQPARHGLAARGGAAIRHDVAGPGHNGGGQDGAEDGQSMDAGASLARHRMRQ